MCGAIDHQVLSASGFLVFVPLPFILCLAARASVDLAVPHGCKSDCYFALTEQTDQYPPMLVTRSKFYQEYSHALSFASIPTSRGLTQYARLPYEALYMDGSTLRYVPNR